MKTAVEWLVDMLELENFANISTYSIACIEKAKEMEKKQITETFVKVSRAHQEALGNKLSLKDMIDYNKIAEVYYNEEYETKED